MSSGVSPEASRIAQVPLTDVGQEAPGFEDVQGFLERFGYLVSASYQVGTLDSTTSDALSKLQSLYGLSVTGRFDDATRAAMTTPRCGMPDMEGGARFVALCAWNRGDLTYAFDSGTDDVAGTAEWQAIRVAFQTWQAAGPIDFREVRLDQSPDIRVGWRPANDPDRIPARMRLDCARASQTNPF
jgi:hypothetical protein